MWGLLRSGTVEWGRITESPGGTRCAVEEGGDGGEKGERGKGRMGRTSSTTETTMTRGGTVAGQDGGVGGQEPGIGRSGAQCEIGGAWWEKSAPAAEHRDEFRDAQTQGESRDKGVNITSIAARWI